MTKITNIDTIEEDDFQISDLVPEIIITKKSNKFFPGVYHVFVFDEMGSKQELHFAENLLEGQHIGRIASDKFNGSYVVSRICYNSKFKGNRFNGNDNLSRQKYDD